MPLGHLSGSLEKACNQTKKALEIKGKERGTQPQKRPHHTHLAGSKDPQTHTLKPLKELGLDSQGVKKLTHHGLNTS